MSTLVAGASAVPGSLVGIPDAVIYGGTAGKPGGTGRPTAGFGRFNGISDSYG
jgi:hypothetical protein